MTENCRVNDCQKRLLVAALRDARQFVFDSSCDEDDGRVVEMREQLLALIDDLVGSPGK